MVPMGGVVAGSVTAPSRTPGSAKDVAADAKSYNTDNMEESDLPASGSSDGDTHVGLTAAAAAAGMSGMPWQPRSQQRSQTVAHGIPYAPSPMDCGPVPVPATLAGAAWVTGQPAIRTGGGLASVGTNTPPAMPRSISARHADIANVSGVNGVGTTASSKPAKAMGGGNGLGSSASVRHSASLATPRHTFNLTSQPQSKSGSGPSVWTGGSGTATSHARGIAGSSLPRNGASAGSDVQPARIAAPAASVGRSSELGGVWGVAQGSSNMDWGSRGSRASVEAPFGSLASNNVRFLNIYTYIFNPPAEM